MQCCGRSAIAKVLMAIQGKRTHLSGQNLTYPPERKERWGKGKKNKTKQTKNKTKRNKKPKATNQNKTKILAKITSLMVPKIFETCKAHT